MKKCKILISVILICTMCFLLFACNDAGETWNGEYEYNGSHFSVTFVLEEDGEYSKVVYKNGNFFSTEKGTYEKKEGSVFLYINGDTGHYTRYEYTDGKLVNNGHVFSRKN